MSQKRFLIFTVAITIILFTIWMAFMIFAFGVRSIPQIASGIIFGWYARKTTVKIKEAIYAKPFKCIDNN